MDNPDFDQAKTLHKQGRYAEAVVYYKKALQTEPNRGQIYRELARSLTRLGMKDEATQASERARQLDPTITREGKGQNVKAQAARALRQAREAEMIGDAVPLLDALRHGYADEREVRDLFLFECSMERAVAPQLTSALSDKSIAVRCLAAEAIARLGDRKAIPRVSSMLSDPVEAVRLAAVKALVAYGDKGLTPLLEGVAQNDASQSVRSEAELGRQWLTRMVGTRTGLWE